jgi:hypothetical protein
MAALPPLTDIRQQEFYPMSGIAHSDERHALYLFALLNKLLVHFS